MDNRVCSLRWLQTAGITLFAVFFIVGQAAGQSRQSGEIRGTVTDSSGGVIAGATITITNLATGVVQHLTTDATGLYDAASVPLGQYSISFAKEGFKQFIRSNVEMHLETITLDAALQVGTTSQSITVNAPGGAGADRKRRAEHYPHCGAGNRTSQCGGELVQPPGARFPA